MEGEGLKAVFAICYPCQNSRLLDPVVKVRLPARSLPHDVDDPVEHLVLQPRVPLSLRRIKKNLNTGCLTKGVPGRCFVFIFSKRS